MAKNSIADSVSEDVIVENIEDTKEKDMNEENKKNTKKTVMVEPLEDTDEIEVVSLIPNVSYKDDKTGDMYEWDKVGHIEYMSFETLRDMWRRHRGYFRNMWLKPNDDRVISKFSLTNIFDKYEFLMDESNYTKKNIDAICQAISDTPNALKFAICNKIKDLVISEKLTNISVIRALEKCLKIDLIEFL